jgi:hypothetical protein
MHASTGGSFAVPCLTFLTSPVPQWLWETFSSCAGGNNVFAARAYNKTAGILAAYPKKVEAGKELKSVQGIGKGSMDKVAHVMLYNKQKICSIAMLIRLARHAYLSSTVTVLCLDASQLPSHAFTAAVTGHHALSPASQPIRVLNNIMFQSELPTPGRECAAD